MKNTIKKLLVYVPLTVALIFGILMVNSTVLADEPIINWTANVVDGKIQYIDDESMLLVKGQVNNAAITKVVFSVTDTDSFDDVKELTNTLVDSTSFEANVERDGTHENIYFYALSDENIEEKVTLGFNKLEACMIVNNNSKAEVLNNTTELIIPIEIKNTKKIDKIVCFSEYKDASLIKDNISDGIIMNEDNNIVVPIDSNNKNNELYHIYALDMEGKVVLYSKLEVFVAPVIYTGYANDIYDIKTLDLLQDYNKNKTIDIWFGVSNCTDNTRMAYSLDENLQTKSDAEIIMKLGEGEKAQSYSKLSVTLEDYPKDGKNITLFLYDSSKGVIFDKKTLLILRDKIDIDDSELCIQGGNEIYSDVNDNDLIVKFGIENLYTNYSPYNVPYKLVIERIDSGLYKKYEIYSWQWVKDELVDNKYVASVKIDSLDNLPREGANYIAHIERRTDDYNYFGIGKKIQFKIVNETPSVIWNEKDVVGTVACRPLNKGFLEGEANGCKIDDYVVFTTESLSKDELEDKVKKQELKKYPINSEDEKYKIKIDEADLPMEIGKKCNIYLIRNTNEYEIEVFDMGELEISYKNPINAFGWGGRYSPSDYKPIYEVNGSWVYFCNCDYSEGKIKGKASLYGYFRNGFDFDEVVWTDKEFETGEEEISWAKSETQKIVTNINNFPGSSVDYYNQYGIIMDDIELDEGFKTITIYVRRTINEEILVYPLGKVVIKEELEPNFQITGIDDENDHITIQYEAYDDNTGVKEIVAKYKRYYGMFGERDEEEIIKIIDTKLPGITVSDTYTFNSTLSLEEQKTMKIVIKNWNGKEKEYSDVLISKPIIEIVPLDNLQTLGEVKTYYSSSRKAEFTVNIKSSDKIEIPISQVVSLKQLIVEVNGSEIEKIEYEDGREEDSYVINMNNPKISTTIDGKYNVRIKAKNVLANNSSNEAIYEFSFNVDDKKPVVTDIEIDGKSSQLTTDKKYTYITNKKVDINIKAEDKESTGVKDIKYYWQDNDGTKAKESIVEIENHPDQASAKTTKDQSFRGYLYANVDDMVGNSADNYVTSGGIIIDLPDKHNSENHIDIILPESGAKDRNGNPLYNKATTITINASDAYAGIRNVEWKVSAANDSSVNGGGTLNINDGNLSDGSWKKVGVDSNIVTAVSKQIVVDGNSDDMTLYVKITDNAGNTSEKTVKFSMDKVKPQISVAYNNQAGDATFNNYYSDTRTATIVVKERYLNTDSANSIISNSLGNKGTISGWKENRDLQNPDNTTYTATITFDKDDRYALSYQCSDRAGNTSDIITTPEFIIDKVNPELSVNFENGNGKNGYYANARSATIAVKELNFEASRVVISGIGAQDYTLSNWTRRDNSYVATITFAKDGVFAFDVSVRDKAGNAGNNVHVPAFTIDLVDPEVVIEGVENKSANNGVVAPKITMSDKNIDVNSIVVELIGANNGKIDITDWYTVSEDGLTYTFKNFEKIKKNDDIYTLKVIAKDLAGNKTQEEIVFAVNRFGSIYILGDNLKKINDKYVKTAKGIELTEVNVNKINGKSVVITLTVNGVPQTLVEGTDYAVIAEEKDADWKQYRYVFSDNLFVKDGSYILAVVSEDEAGNKNNNNMEDKEAGIKFGVDATAPIVSAINFEANHYYDENGMDFVVSVKDNMVLDSVAVYINGNQVAFTENDEMYTFHIDESNRRQEVKIVAKDAAGNETIENYEGILVAGNFFIRLLHNRLALIIMGGATLLALGGGLFFVIRKIAK